MKVDINDVRVLHAGLHAINKIPLEELEFYDGDKPIPISANDLEEWRFTGLNNVDFITMTLLTNTDTGNESI